MPTRRLVIMTGAAGAAIIAGAGGYNVLHSDLSRARAPWREAGGSFGDVRLDALSYAVLAPSPHNMQPWLIRLDEDNALTLYCDLARILPNTDPPNRQIVIGFGAFLELLRQAAAQYGKRLNIAPFPEGEPYPTLDQRPVARVMFLDDPAVSRDPLFGAALIRRTVRTPFDQDRPLTAEILDAVAAAVRSSDGMFEWTTDEEKIRSLKEICKDGWRAETAAAGPHGESVALTRIGEKEINDNPDGISLSGPLMEGMRVAGVLTREKMKEPSSQMFKESVKFYNAAIDSAMAFGWLSTAGNTRLDQLRAGAGWMRLTLAAATEGVSVQPLSQVLQEFPEMAPLYARFHDFTGLRALARAQGLFRFGYARFPQPSPRWPLSTRIIPAS